MNAQELYIIGLRAEYNEEDVQKAFSYYKRAAEMGHTKSKFKVGKFYYYYTNEEGKHDYRQSVVWLLEASKEGDIHAMYLLGKCFLMGQGVEQDYKKAISLFERVVSFTKQYINQTEEYEEEIDCYGASMAQLAACYFHGLGVNENYDKVAECAQLSAMIAKNGFAMYYLGICYYYGCGLPKNENLSKFWFMEGAKKDENACIEALEKYFGIEY